MSCNAKPSPVPQSPADAESDPELRGGPRTAMFVAATCVARDSVQPVRVRNMSRDGALIEGPVLPGEGETFDLIRGHLRVSARSMWSRGDQGGVVFLAPVDVAQWMARIAPGHQQQVDALIDQARLDIAAGRPPSFGAPPATQASGAENIAAAIALLEELESTLVDDPQVVERHMAGLQAIDRALQLLRSAAGKPPA